MLHFWDWLSSKTYLIFRLPEDIYQIAKVSKILQIMEKGCAADFKNKCLEEIDINVNEINFDSDEEVVSGN